MTLPTVQPRREDFVCQHGVSAACSSILFIGIHSPGLPLSSTDFICLLGFISANIKEYLWNMPSEFHPQHFYFKVLQLFLNITTVHSKFTFFSPVYLSIHAKKLQKKRIYASFIILTKSILPRKTGHLRCSPPSKCLLSLLSSVKRQKKKYFCCRTN